MLHHGDWFGQKKTKNQAWNQPPTFGLGGGLLVCYLSGGGMLVKEQSEDPDIQTLLSFTWRSLTSPSPSKASLRQAELWFSFLSLCLFHLCQPVDTNKDLISSSSSSSASPALIAEPLFCLYKTRKKRAPGSPVMPERRWGSS